MNSDKIPTYGKITKRSRGKNVIKIRHKGDKERNYKESKYNNDDKKEEVNIII